MILTTNWQQVNPKSLLSERFAIEDDSDHHSDFDDSAFVTMNDGDFDFAESYDHFSDGYDSF